VVVEAAIDGTWVAVGRVDSNTESPVDIGLTAAPRGIQRLRLRFTEPSAVDTIARVFEVEVYGITNS
jgi:hypothetical protein